VNELKCLRTGTAGGIGMDAPAPELSQSNNSANRKGDTSGNAQKQNNNSNSSSTVP